MKENFFTSLFGEKDKDGKLIISSKRWMSVTTASVLLWVIVYASLKAANASERFAIIIATMSFILVMAGVATLPQLLGLLRGNAVPDNTTNETKTP